MSEVQVGERLAAIRKGRGLRQIEVAKRAGIPPETLNRIEKGRPTAFETVAAICQAMGVGLGALEDGESDAAPASPVEQRLAAVEEELRTLTTAVEEVLRRLPLPRD